MEYKSSVSLLGLPLIHVNFGGMEDGRPRVGMARGWVAIGRAAMAQSQWLLVLVALPLLLPWLRRRNPNNGT